MVPSTLLIYGPPKIGKSFDMMALCGASCVVIEGKGAASDVARSELGFEPVAVMRDPKLATNIDYLLDTIESWWTRGDLANFWGVYIDDGSLLLGDSMVAWRDSAKAAYQRAIAANVKDPKEDARYPYTMLDRSLSRLRRFGREIPIWLLLNFHARDPVEDKGIVVSPGSPEVPSSNKVTVLPAACHTVLHAEADPTSLDPWWPFRYMGNPLNPKWIASDRNGILNPGRPSAPMNLRELLGSRGMWFPRPVGLEWLDTWAETAATAMSAGAKPIDVFTMWKDSGQNPYHLRWALRDGIARYQIRRTERSPFEFPQGSVGGPPVLN